MYFSFLSHDQLTIQKEVPLAVYFMINKSYIVISYIYELIMLLDQLKLCLKCTYMYILINAIRE